MKQGVKHRAKAMWLLALTGFCIPSLSMRCLAQEPELLLRAQSIATGEQWQFPEEYTWVSDTKQFCQRSFVSTAAPQNGPFWFDTKTKTVTYDEELKARVKLGYSDMRLSPDHKWILSGSATEYDASNRPRRNVYYLASMHDNTTRRVEIGSHFLGVQGCSDSRHWIEFTGKGTIESVAIGSVDDPQRMRTIRIAPKSMLRDPGIFGGWRHTLQHLLVLSPDRILTLIAKRTEPAGILVREISLQGTKPLREYLLASPRNHYLRQLIPSPDGKQFV